MDVPIYPDPQDEDIKEGEENGIPVIECRDHKEQVGGDETEIKERL